MAAEGVVAQKVKRNSRTFTVPPSRMAASSGRIAIRVVFEYQKEFREGEALVAPLRIELRTLRV
jgi:hypothetical protein